MKKLILVLALLFMSQLSIGQNKKGNIVEYFGKEKVENINEGEVVHIFKEGLILGANSFSFGRGGLPTNPLFARILIDGKSGISEGKQEQLGMLNKNRPGIKSR